MAKPELRTMFFSFDSRESTEATLHRNFSRGGGRYVRAMQLVQPNLTPAAFANMVETAFFTKINPEAIPFDCSPIDSIDQTLADELKYKILPVASAALIQEGRVTAWMRPTLVRPNHPLALEAMERRLYATVSEHQGGIHYPSLNTAYYLRCTAENRIKALAEISCVLGNHQVNIRAVIQPEIKSGQAEGAVAFLFNPCTPEQISQALTATSQLPGCLVNTSYRVLSDHVINPI